MNGWEADKRWSDRFLPEIKMILGLHLIGEPPIEEDCERNTDLIVLKMDPVRIACRIRKNEYYARYPNEITIRSGRPSGAKTELAKIIEGWGNYLFYGFANCDETALAAWRLCDLSALRLWLMRRLWIEKEMPGTHKKNGDGSSTFHAFDVTTMKEIIVADKGF